MGSNLIIAVDKTMDFTIAYFNTKNLAKVSTLHKIKIQIAVLFQ